MAGSVNRVVLCGFVGQDPEVRRTKTGGNRMANLSVATSKRWRDKDGERQETTTWHRIVTFDDDLAAMVEKQIKKGSQVLVIGELQNRKWTDKDGVERWTTEIVVNPFGGNTIQPITPDHIGEGGGNRPPPPEGPESYGLKPAQQREQKRETPDEVPF